MSQSLAALFLNHVSYELSSSDRLGFIHVFIKLFIPSTMMFNKLYIESPEERDFYESIQRIARQKGLMYIGEPLDFMYQAERYFDTNYHLVAESRVQHTQKLINLLGSDLNFHCRRQM
jgi:hypothetical protein